MGVVFTEEQQKVIDLRNRNILVSAAAGSGKTAVLVERIITRLTKDADPIDVDKLLIVTYTEAAAAEMKERIHSAIERALEQDSENVHLQRQATLIHQAQVTTIHSFCLSVIRDYFHTISLDPGFRIGEEGELKLLKHDVIEEVIESYYAEGTEEFLEFVESYASGKDDRKLEEIILQLYEFSRSYPNPKEWLNACIKQYQVESVNELEEKSFVKELLEDLKRYIKDWKETLLFGVEICESEEGPIVYRDVLDADLLFMEKAEKCMTLDAMQKCFIDLKWTRMPVNRDKSVAEEKIALVKSLREEVKEAVKKVIEQYFFASVEEMQKDLKAAENNMQVLAELINVFSDAFAEKKKSKNLIDFGDMEHYALQILTKEQDGKLVPSAVAQEYQQKYEEVMIDEYQDSNLIQEAILTSVSKVSKGIFNVFMVGDVKQSIYRFRLSRPELFMEKYYNYSQEDSECQRIDLHKNFRSREEVLDSVNYIFEQIMTGAFGGITYDEKAALHKGAPYEKQPGNDTEVLVIDTGELQKQEKLEIEARAVAKRIKELRQSHQVLDKKTGEYRSIRYSDIVVLTRSLMGWTEVFARILNQEGIPTYTSSKEGYFQTREIQLLLDYLRVIDNPRQDIPLAAVLKSMFAGITNEEMAILKCSTNKKTLYERVCQYVEEGKQITLQEKLSAFLKQIHKFQELIPYTAISGLLWKILEDTGYAKYIASLPGGRQRAANLEMLMEKAISFEGTSYKGLFNFIRYIEQLQKYNVDYGEANLLDENMDVVCLMSIHKSKGLEFPIVFVAGMGKRFNNQNARGSIVIHPELGVGIDAVDTARRTKTSTLLKRVLQRKIVQEETAEELRVLYVALTRAKEKMILTGTVKNMESTLKKLQKIGKREERVLPYSDLTSAVMYFDWILPALYRNKCFTKVLIKHEIDVPFSNCMYQEDKPIIVEELDLEAFIEEELAQSVGKDLAKQSLYDWDVEMIYDARVKEQIENQFTYKYPYDADRMIKQKMTVSELKKMAYMDEESKSLFEEEEIVPLLPKFIQEDEVMSGASRGTAYHRFLELLDFTKEYEESCLENELLQKQREGLLTDEMAKCIKLTDILQFLDSRLAKRMQNAAKQKRLFVEQPFVLGVGADEVYSNGDANEMVLIQGIIDVYFEENDEIVLADYKTDRVFQSDELIERYHTQLEYYAQALERVTGKKVKEKIIYSFAMKKEIEVL